MEVGTVTPQTLHLAFLLTLRHLGPTCIRITLVMTLHPCFIFFRIYLFTYFKESKREGERESALERTHVRISRKRGWVERVRILSRLPSEHGA